ncbi:MAG TPA: AMP-binding protein [Candidatus Dormibacteraeota bacterium]|nr:AMP-binding protein [Candidatus Dormibacteraeota bacterium]
MNLDILAAHAAQGPERLALVDDGGRTRTYAELNARANRAANALAALGLAAGDRCIHVHYNCIEGFEVGHALRKLGAVSVPMNTRLRGSEIAYLINDSGARVVVAGPEFTGAIDEARTQVEDAQGRRWLVLGDGAPGDGWTSYEAVLAEASDAAPDGAGALGAPTMIYTAGTTGNPKGALRGGGVDPETIATWMAAFKFNSEDVHLLAGPSYHSAPGVFSGLQQMLGAATVVMRRFDPVLALRLIAEHRVTTTFMAPILVKRIVDVPAGVRAAHDVSSMRCVIVAAAPFPGELKRRAVELFGPSVFEFYGATETGLVTLITPEELLRRPDSCGRALPSVEVLLLDDDGREVPEGQPGELWARSPALFTAYHNKPEATERNRRDGYFTVGDVAWRDPDGYIHICDRKVDMVISGGVNIYPAEIEAVLHAHPAVEDCAVIGVPDPEWGESLKAVVKLHPGAGATDVELIGFVGERLAAFKRPRSVEFVDEFPRDSAGKLLKRLLRDRHWSAEGRQV